MNHFVYFADIFVTFPKLKGDVLLVLENSQSKSELLCFFYKSLNFPYYFGENWNALYDCLVDLNWITENRIFIVHKDIPLNNSGLEAKKYIKLLSDVAIFWEQEDAQEVSIFFPENYKNKIEEMRNIKIRSF